jgi:L-lactate dehydrogenase complex protein LldG
MTHKDQRDDLVLSSVRQSLGAGADDDARRAIVAARLADHPRGVIPQRGEGDEETRVALFCRMIEAVSATTRRLASSADIPAAIADYLRGVNLPLTVRHGNDLLFASLDWPVTLTRSVGFSDGRDLVSVSRAIGAVAESGTLVLVSGPDNPTTLNFLPDYHIVVVAAADIAGNYETVWDRLRARFGATLPRVVNWISGPSRSADVEQTIILGAHGPRCLHVLVVES